MTDIAWEDYQRLCDENERLRARVAGLRAERDEALAQRDLKAKLIDDAADVLRQVEAARQIKIAQVAAMRRVVEAARSYRDGFDSLAGYGTRLTRLRAALSDYDALSSLGETKS